MAGIVNCDLGLPPSGLLQYDIFDGVYVTPVFYHLSSAYDYGIDIGCHSRINDMRVDIVNRTKMGLL